MKIAVDASTDSQTQSIRYSAFQADALAADAPPSRILIAPWGEVRSRSGEFVLDEQAARLTLDAFARHGTDIPVDFDHQSLGGPYSAPDGLAPAAGWIKKLVAVAPSEVSAVGDSAPGLWADVEWTTQGAVQLATRQYRYLSPVAIVRRSDRRMISLHSAALTNKPAIPNMQAVVNADDAPVETAEPNGAEPSDAGADDAWTQLRTALALDESADEAVVLSAATERLTAFRAGEAERRASDRVAAAFSAGKLAPSQRDWAVSLARRDPAGFDEWLASAPVLVPAGRLAAPSAGRSARRASDAVRRAQREYREAGPVLAAICTEEAFIRDSLRQSGLLESDEPGAAA